MRTMALIDQYGYTMEHMGRTYAEAAEAREAGNWEHAHRAGQMAEKYRIKAQSLRRQIAAKLGEKDNADNEEETGKVTQIKKNQASQTNRASLAKAA